jgi:hypothetical protein
MRRFPSPWLSVCSINRTLTHARAHAQLGGEDEAAAATLRQALVERVRRPWRPFWWPFD